MSESKPSLNDLKIQRQHRPTGGSGKGWWIGVVVLLLLVVAIGVWWLKQGKVLEVRTVAAREVATGTNRVERTVLNASGYVTARRQATVSSKLTGKVVEVMIEEGTRVEAGQTLAKLDDTNVRTGLRLAEAQLVSATNALAETRVRIREAEQELARAANLVKNRIATQADYDHAEASALALKAKLEQQQSDVKVAEREIENWQQQLDDTIIRAPFTGIVTAKNAQPGEMISPISAGGGFTRTGIGTIVDMQSLEVEVDVNESYIQRVEPGQEVEATLDAYPEWKIPCKVIAIIPTADRQKSTVKVRVGFDKLDKRILPEMGVKVGFRESAGGIAAPGSGRGVVVPKAAVHQDGGRDIVMILANDRAERRAVTVASSMGDEAVIGAGVSVGENVITNWPEGMKDGVAVRIAEGK